MNEFKVQIGNVNFILNPDTPYQGDPSDLESTQAHEKICALHAAMKEEFENPQNLADFVALLAINHETAFQVYNETKGRSVM